MCLCKKNYSTNTRSHAHGLRHHIASLTPRGGEVRARLDERSGELGRLRSALVQLELPQLAKLAGREGAGGDEHLGEREVGEARGKLLRKERGSSKRSIVVV